MHGTSTGGVYHKTLTLDKNYSQEVDLYNSILLLWKPNLKLVSQSNCRWQRKNLNCRKIEKFGLAFFSTDWGHLSDSKVLSDLDYC